MLRSKKHQRFYSMIAIWAILLNTLMPLFAQALELKVGDRVTPSMAVVAEVTADSNAAAYTTASGVWQKLCSATGSTWIKLSAQGEIIAQTKIAPADASIDAPSKGHFSYCLYCLQHLDNQALLAMPSAHGLAVALSSLSVLETPSSFYTRIVWLMPAVRAPPSLFV
jgi:hypothetical protein